jgi:putative protease
LDGDEAVHNGDGLCFFNQRSELIGVRVNRVEGMKIYPKDGAAHLHLSVGTEIWRNADTRFNKLLEQSDLCRKIVVQMRLVERDDGLQLRLTDEDGIESNTQVIVEKEKAAKVGTIEALALKQLKKTGGTVFLARDISVEISSGLFFPSAVFNDLRRKAFAGHLEIRRQSYVIETKWRSPNTYPCPVAAVDDTDNITNRKAAEFYLRHGIRPKNPGFSQAGTGKNRALMTTKYCIKAQLGMCPKLKKQSRTVAEPLVLADNTGKYELGFDCDKCEMKVTRKGEL